MTLFGGVMTNKTKIGDSGAPDIYIFLNFNDFYNAFIFIFHLLLVNNFNVTVYYIFIFNNNL